MSSHSTYILARRGLHQSRLLQISILVAIWYLCQLLVEATGLPIPSGVIGLFVVLIALASGRVSAFSLRRGANWFLAEMLLFFVPAVLAVLDHREFLGILGLKILLIIAVGTATVMGTTALTVDFCYRWRMRHAQH